MSEDTVNEGPAKKITTRAVSRRHPFLRDRPQGFYYPDAVGVVQGYPKTREAYDQMVERNRVRYAKWQAEGKIMKRLGVPDGWAGRKAELVEVRAAAAVEAKRIVKYMIESDIIAPENEKAEEALEAVIGIVRARSAENPELYAHPAKDRIAAARVVLDFTKQRPATKTSMELTKAEDFLAVLAEQSK